MADNGNGTSVTTVIAGRATARAVQTANTKCFTPDDRQIAHLVGSRTYSSTTVATWQGAQAVTLVPVRLCPEARVKVSEVTYNNASMKMLREGISGSPAIRQKLRGAGRDADDVLAVDNKDGQLMVYIF
jgi:hypothetical protein